MIASSSAVTAYAWSFCGNGKVSGSHMWRGVGKALPVRVAYLGSWVVKGSCTLWPDDPKHAWAPKKNADKVLTIPEHKMCFAKASMDSFISCGAQLRRCSIRVLWLFSFVLFLTEKIVFVFRLNPRWDCLRAHVEHTDYQGLLPQIPFLTNFLNG